LAKEGWAIAIVDVDEEASRAIATEVATEHGVPTLGLGVDIRNEKQVGDAVQRITETLPQLVGLVNNAGVSSPVPFLEVTSAEWHRVMDVNVTGTFHVTRAVAPILAENRLGRIVSVSSAAAEKGGSLYSLAAYAGSKGAILGISRTLARELGPYGVTVNAVAPGSIDTDIMGGTLTEDRIVGMLGELPVGRVGTVDDVAGLINFLLGREAGYITGVTYDVNGGSFIG
jgi:2-hydroxycyclohexanecarboxyl-CoA dehydrogenase